MTLCGRPKYLQKFAFFEFLSNIKLLYLTHYKKEQGDIIHEKNIFSIILFDWLIFTAIICHLQQLLPVKGYCLKSDFVLVKEEASRLVVRRIFSFFLAYYVLFFDYIFT